MIDKVNDEFIVDCTNNSKEERQQVYKFLIDNRNYCYSYLNNNANIIVCNKDNKIGYTSWHSLKQYYSWHHAKKDIPVYTFEQFKEMYLDEFVLPEKWCIKLKDNYDIINKWGKNYWENITGWGNLNASSKYMICSFKNKLCTSANSTNGYTEITFEQFKKYILKQDTIKKTYTIKELRNAPIQIKVYSEEQAIKLAYAVGYDWDWRPSQAKYPIYCYLSNHTCPSWNYLESDNKNKSIIIEFNQIENFMENKKIIGYKLIKPKYKEAALAICHTVGNWENSLAEYDINANQKEYIRKLTNAKVLDLWFEKIYEQEKQIVKMYSSNKGEFEIEVIDGKAYYRPENKELPKEWIKSIIKSFNTTIIDGSYMETPYKITISSLNVGCYHNCKKEDWENVYKLLK